ncbi:hypothetical protein BY458DRAFT_549629 [Sporodiniella umbellata]|nr:hypothetical protein BY458DRAFT_549629 [Sporodiniella umbellata]
MIQKRLQKRMGIVKSDLNSDISYIVKFILAEHLSELPNYFQKKLNAQNGIFKAEYCSLPKIPVFLHKLAPKIIELNISGNSKMKIAGDFLQTCQYLKILTVENNEYSKIRISFAEVPSLKYLNISKNKIKNLKNGNLERIPNLRSLDLSNNKISEIPQSFNKGFRQLTSLNISGNRLTTFPRLICNIVSLTHLDISFNRIGELPLEIGQLANLIELYAIASHIQGTLPASFIQLTKLTTLDIRQNFITALNVVFDLPALEVLLVDYNSTGVINFEIKNLKVLKMYRNHLTQFSLRNIRGGQSLTTLNLSNCKLSSLPEDLFENIQGLESLVLDSNTLSMLPPSIVVLQKLATLSVQNNHLEALPDAIGKLTSLTYLYAQKNNMKTLPVEIWNCISLKTLNCSSNLLGSFPEPCLLEDTAANIKLIPQKNVRQGLIKHLGASYQDATLLLDTPQTSFVSNSLNFNSKETLENSGHPVFPLTLVLSALFLGDNQLTDDVWVPVSYLKSLRLLNLSFNDIYEIPSGNLCPILHELYLSGNNFTFLPGDFLKSLSYLRILVVSANKLQTLPHEITKLRKLEVLDVGNNLLNYNLTNSSYDWNWNENELLKYLNFSGNKRLTILRVSKPKDRLEENDTSYFSVLKKLRTVGLIDNTVHDIHSLSQSCNLRVRTTEREVSNMSYGVADWLGQSSHLSTWDFTSSKFSEKGDGSLFAIFDPVFQTFRTQTEKQQLSWGCNLTWKLKEKLESMFIAELLLVGPEFTINSAIRRVFYNLEHYISSEPTIEKDLGASVALCYISGTKLYVANVGDVMVVMSRNNGQVFEIAQNHLPLNPSEASRVRNSEGYISKSGLLNDRLSVSRCLGHFQHAPAVNCDPFVQDINLSENDEFVIMASKGLWNTMSYQTAVDIARTEKGDLMLAAQKLRDFALSYGSTENIMVMIIGVSDLFSKSDKQTKKSYMGSDGTIEGVMLAKSAKRRGKEEVPGDSTLARLEKEVAPPVSQLALVFTDVKNSTQFWETQPENMRSAIKLHDAIMRRTLRNIGGYEVKTEGDAFMVCFKNVTAALLWCFTVQTLLLEADWPAGITKSDEGKLSQDSDNVVLYKGLSVRMGIHCGTPVSERNPITQRMDYFGPVVNKASRICNVADGGEICISSDVISVLKLFPCFFNDSVEIEEILGDDGGPYSIASNLRLLRTFGHHIVPLGKVQLKGLETPENLSLIYPKKLEGREMLKKKIETSSKLLVNEQISPELQAREQKSPDNFTGEQSPFEASFLKQNLLQRQPMDRNSSEKSITDIPLPFKQCLSDGMPIGTVTTADIISSLPADHISAQPTARNALRIIDPAVVCALNSIAFRLERLTSGYYSSQHSSEHTFEDPSIIRKLKYENFEQTSIGLTMDKYLREQATDEELIRTMENCVSRIENSASSLFVQKIGRFSNVLERLSEAVELDPLYILKALQMYAESFPK